MLIIDADAHVMEPEDAFAERFFDPAYRDRRPRIVRLDDSLYWMVDETLFPRLKGAKNLHYMGIPTRQGDFEHQFTRRKWISNSARELTDPKDRLEVMDKAGIDIQVIHPSFFFDYPTSWGGTDPKLGSAICSAYNRWIAEKCDAADGRLSRSAQVCLDDVPGAVREVRRVKAAGAACVYVNGTIGERKLSSAEHYPFFETLCEENISLSVHIGWCFPPLTRFMDTPYEARTTALIFPLLFGFSDVISADLLGRFDTLHVAFLEGGCDWIPFLLDQMDNIYKVFTKRLDWKARNLPCLPQDYIRECDRLFFNTEPDSELLPHVIEKIGNRFVVGSDMPHTETTDKRSKHRLILAREDLSAEDKRRMLLTNPKAFFRVSRWDQVAPRALAFAETQGAV
jgi:predicted TIM-barrel fold metal-dependent hydrolase